MFLALLIEIKSNSYFAIYLIGLAYINLSAVLSLAKLLIYVYTFNSFIIDYCWVKVHDTHRISAGCCRYLAFFEVSSSYVCL